MSSLAAHFHPHLSADLWDVPGADRPPLQGCTTGPCLLSFDPANQQATHPPTCLQRAQSHSKRARVFMFCSAWVCQIFSNWWIFIAAVLKSIVTQFLLMCFDWHCKTGLICQADSEFHEIILNSMETMRALANLMFIL